MPPSVSNHTNKVNLEWKQFIANNQEIYLDSETYSFEGLNPMSNLGLRTIQLGNANGELYYLIWEEFNQDDKSELINSLVNKDIYLFNLNFDLSQLAHNGFKISENKWYDIALLARISWNHKVDKGRMSLESLALNYLNSTNKRDYIEELKATFRIDGKKVRSKDKLYSAKGLPYNEIFKEYALNDVKVLIE